MKKNQELKTEQRTYDPNAYSIKAMAKQIDAVVTDIKQDKLANLVPYEVLAKWKNVDSESLGIEIVAECSDGVIRRRTIQLPTTEEIHPSSNLARWRLKYGSFPVVGQKVILDLDDKGFYQFRV